MSRLTSEQAARVFGHGPRLDTDWLDPPADLTGPCYWPGGTCGRRAPEGERFCMFHRGSRMLVQDDEPRIRGMFEDDHQ